MKKSLLTIIFFVMISGLTSYSQDPLNEPFFRRKVIFEPSKDDDYYTQSSCNAAATWVLLALIIVYNQLSTIVYNQR